MPNMNEEAESSESIDFEYRLAQGLTRDQQLDSGDNEDNEQNE